MENASTEYTPDVAYSHAYPVDELAIVGKWSSESYADVRYYGTDLSRA